MTRRLTALGAALLALSLGAVACGGDERAGNSVSQVELNRAVRAAEREARQEAETEAKLARAQGKVNTSRMNEDSSGSSSSASSGSAAIPVTSDEVGTTTYVNESAGWSAEVPAGGGWSDGVETAVNDGLLRTTFDGPGDSMLTIDSTPYEAPAFGGAPIDSRSGVSHPVFGSAEKIVFQGNSNFARCATAGSASTFSWTMPPAALRFSQVVRATLRKPKLSPKR